MENQNNNNDCRPSVRGEIKKARNSGYDINSSFFEFIDNACDTDCQHIKIEIKEKMEHGIKKLVKIIISDDFINGIEFQHLHKIFSWTFERERLSNDIGEYGTGFKCASVNMANCLSVYTFDSKNNKYIQAIADWDEMEETNRWDPKILEINQDFYKDYHPFTQGSSFVLENLRHEFFQNHKTPHWLAENLYNNIGYHYKYYLQQYPYKNIIVKGLYQQGKDEKVLNIENQQAFYFYFDHALQQIESRIFVYKDQANFYNFFIQRSNNNNRIELVEFLEKRKNGNSHLRCTEVSHRILASMSIIDEILLKSCIYDHDEHTLLSFGNVDVIQNNRIVGRDISFRKPRIDAMAEYIRHEIHFSSKNLNQIMGIQFNKKSHFMDNDLCYSLEYLQMYHEREMIRLANKPVIEVKELIPTLLNIPIEVKTDIETPINTDVVESIVKNTDTIENKIVIELQKNTDVIENIPINTDVIENIPINTDVVENIVKNTDETPKNTNVIENLPKNTEDNKRRNFSLETKLQIIKKQECRDSDFDFLLKDQILPFDYDHKTDRTNNSEENCQALCVISHAIKTRFPSEYKKLTLNTQNKEDYIIDLMNCLSSSKIFMKMLREKRITILPIEEASISSGIFVKKR
jgi:hypothetical protein